MLGLQFFLVPNIATGSAAAVGVHLHIFPGGEVFHAVFTCVPHYPAP